MREMSFFHYIPDSDITFVTGNVKKLEEVTQILGTSFPYKVLVIPIPPINMGKREKRCLWNCLLIPAELHHSNQ